MDLRHWLYLLSAVIDTAVQVGYGFAAWKKIWLLQSLLLRSYIICYAKEKWLVKLATWERSVHVLDWYKAVCEPQTSCVYALLSIKTGSFYIGSKVNLCQRLSEHFRSVHHF